VLVDVGFKLYFVNNPDINDLVECE